MTNEEIIRKAAGTINGNKDLLLEYSILLQATFGRVIDRINTIDTIQYLHGGTTMRKIFVSPTSILYIKYVQRCVMAYRSQTNVK